MDEDEDGFGSNDQDKFYGICPGDNNFNHKLINITNFTPGQTLFIFTTILHKKLINFKQYKKKNI